jgi:hypothetical protein
MAAVDLQIESDEIYGVLHEFVIYLTLLAMASWILLFLLQQTIYKHYPLASASFLLLVSHLFYATLGFMVIVLEMGSITPLVGLDVFIIKGVAKNMPLRVIFAGVISFLVASAMDIILSMIFPEIGLNIPT